MHDIMVKTFFAFGGIAAIAHLAVWFWRPWLNVGI